MKRELGPLGRLIVIGLIYLAGMSWAFYDFANATKSPPTVMAALAAVCLALNVIFWFVYAVKVPSEAVSKPLAIAAGVGLVLYLLTYSPWSSMTVIVPGLSGLLLPALRRWQEQ